MSESDPGALNFVSSMEEKDLNWKLSDCHLGRKKSPTCNSSRWSACMKFPMAVEKPLESCCIFSKWNFAGFFCGVELFKLYSCLLFFRYEGWNLPGPFQCGEVLLEVLSGALLLLVMGSEWGTLGIKLGKLWLALLSCDMSQDLSLSKLRWFRGAV